MPEATKNGKSRSLILKRLRFTNNTITASDKNENKARENTIDISSTPAASIGLTNIPAKPHIEAATRIDITPLFIFTVPHPKS